MKLEDIGFYTLSDERAANVSEDSPLQRCEVILTDECNFNCPYCRGVKSKYSGRMPFGRAIRVINLWAEQGLKNIRFSGGEPTLYPMLGQLVTFARRNDVERVAVSTNGSADWDEYAALIDAGVNDFSISLDSGCCAVGEQMTGGVIGSWDKVTKNIENISKQTYCSVGMVFTEHNVDRAVSAVEFADSLGVSDIRIIPAAQYGKALENMDGLSDDILAKYPVLRYRIKNYKEGVGVRGLSNADYSNCWLALDDMAVIDNYHFPCIIYLREGGDPIGRVGENMREERAAWFESHDSHADKICSNNCLDVCRDYNNCAEALH